MGTNRRVGHTARGSSPSSPTMGWYDAETGYNPTRPERFPHHHIYGTDLYAPVLLNPTARRKEETVNYAAEVEKLEVLKRRLARLEAKSVTTAVDEIGIKFIHEEMERISSRLPKDWDQLFCPEARDYASCPDCQRGRHKKEESEKCQDKSA